MAAAQCGVPRARLPVSDVYNEIPLSIKIAPSVLY